MPDLKRRWLHLKAAFGPKPQPRSSSLAKTALGLSGLLGPVGRSAVVANSPSTVFKELALETWLAEPPNPLVNTPIANSAGLRVGTSWARRIIAGDLPPDRGLIR